MKLKDCRCICHESIGNGVLSFQAHENQKCVCNGGKGFNDFGDDVAPPSPGGIFRTEAFAVVIGTHVRAIFYSEAEADGYVIENNLLKFDFRIQPTKIFFNSGCTPITTKLN